MNLGRIDYPTMRFERGEEPGTRGVEPPCPLADRVGIAKSRREKGQHVLASCHRRDDAIPELPRDLIQLLIVEPVEERIRLEFERRSQLPLIAEPPNEMCQLTRDEDRAWGRLQRRKLGLLGKDPAGFSQFPEHRNLVVHRSKR